MIPTHVRYILRYLNSNAFTPRFLLSDELTKVLTAHKHLSGMGVDYFSPDARWRVSFVRAQPEETEIQGCPIGTMQ